MLMEKFEDLVTKIDSEFLIIRKELKEMQDGRRDNHALDDYLKNDTPMCEPNEANYVQRYHGGYHDHEPINSRDERVDASHNENVNVMENQVAELVINSIKDLRNSSDNPKLGEAI
ncbi:hypothetical protein Tco_0379059 [Tanacetum coccineum]